MEKCYDASARVLLCVALSKVSSRQSKCCFSYYHSLLPSMLILFTITTFYITIIHLRITSSSVDGRERTLPRTHRPTRTICYTCTPRWIRSLNSYRSTPRTLSERERKQSSVKSGTQICAYCYISGNLEWIDRPARAISKATSPLRSARGNTATLDRGILRVLPKMSPIVARPHR